MITDRIGRHEVLLPINHKNYNFRRRKEEYQGMNRENLHYKFLHSFYGIETKVVIGWYKLQLKMWLVYLNYNFEYDWLIELSDNKLSDNNLTSELEENRPNSLPRK